MIRLPLVSNKRLSVLNNSSKFTRKLAKYPSSEFAEI
jgi:hypothetical protein